MTDQKDHRRQAVVASQKARTNQTITILKNDTQAAPLPSVVRFLLREKRKAMARASLTAAGQQAMMIALKGVLAVKEVKVKASSPVKSRIPVALKAEAMIALKEVSVAIEAIQTENHTEPARPEAAKTDQKEALGQTRVRKGVSKHHTKRNLPVRVEAKTGQKEVVSNRAAVKSLTTAHLKDREHLTAMITDQRVTRKAITPSKILMLL